MISASPWRQWPETQHIIGLLHACNIACRFTGGAVRDTLAGRVPDDIDLACMATSEQLAAILAEADITFHPKQQAFGNLRAQLGTRKFDLTPASRLVMEGAHNMYLPTDQWQDDAMRRDFTYNALYMTPEGEVEDYCGGRADLAAGRTVFLQPALRLTEREPNCILRFFRFHAEYGKTGLSAEGVEACAAHAHRLPFVPGPQTRHEMFKLLAAARPHEPLGVMYDHAMLDYVCGYRFEDWSMMERLREHEAVPAHKPDARLRLLVLLHQGVIAPEEALMRIAQGWHIPVHFVQELQHFIAYAKDGLPKGQTLNAEETARLAALRMITAS